MARPSHALAAGLADPRRALLALGVLAALACGAGALFDRTAFFGAWLAAWWFWIAATLGAQALLWMHRLTGGDWGAIVAPAAARLRDMLPAVAVLGLPVLAGLSLLYPWARAGWTDTAEQPAFRAAWLSPAFFGARLAACGVLWCLLAAWHRRAHAGKGCKRGATKGAAAGGLIAAGYTVSLAAVDTIASLVPEWYSAGFGLVVLSVVLNTAMAACAWQSARAAPPALRIDLGNLMLTFTLTWIYLAFVQFQIIWAENLPHEIAWYVPRLSSAWAMLGLGVVLAGFAIPLALLLSRRVKSSARGLRGVSALVLVASWLETLWWVGPSLPGAGAHAAVILPFATLALGALAAASRRWHEGELRLALHGESRP